MPSESADAVFLTQHGGWRVRGSRVSLDSVIHAHREGLSPLEITEQFTTLSVKQVEDALAFYEHNRDRIDAYLVEQAVRWEELRRQSENQNPELSARLRAARAALADRKEAE